MTASFLMAGKQNLITPAHAAGQKIDESITAPSRSAERKSGRIRHEFSQGSGEQAERFLVNLWQTSTTASTVEGAWRRLR